MSGIRSLSRAFPSRRGRCQQGADFQHQQARIEVVGRSIGCKAHKTFVGIGQTEASSIVNVRQHADNGHSRCFDGAQLSLTVRARAQRRGEFAAQGKVVVAAFQQLGKNCLCLAKLLRRKSNGACCVEVL